MHSTVPVPHEPSVILLGSIFGDIIFVCKHAVFITERVFEIAGKTHYSNVSFWVSSIISTGL